MDIQWRFLGSCNKFFHWQCIWYSYRMTLSRIHTNNQSNASKNGKNSEFHIFRGTFSGEHFPVPDFPFPLPGPPDRLELTILKLKQVHRAGISKTHRAFLFFSNKIRYPWSPSSLIFHLKKLELCFLRIPIRHCGEKIYFQILFSFPLFCPEEEWKKKNLP